MQPAVVIAIYSVFVVLSSLLGGFLPAMIHLTHRRTQFLMSLIGGLMLGIGFFHLLPHSFHTAIGVDRGVSWLMLGLLTTFVLIRVFGAHSHAAEGEHAECETALEGAKKSHDSHTSTGHNHADSANYRWVGLGLGLSLHTLLDGVALAAAVLSETSHPSGSLFWGFAVFVGIFLHKPLDSLSITALMATGGWSIRAQSLVNIMYAMMCPLGALAFYLGVRDTPYESVAIGCALAFAAGIFICISLSDLLPELQFHSHDRVPLTVLLFLGVGLAYGLKYLEPPHLHEASTEDSPQNHPIDHHDHDHHHSPSHGAVEHEKSK